MLQLGFIRENREYVIERLGVKHFKDAEQIIDNVISQDNKRRNTQTELDKVKAEANSIAKQVGMLYKQGTFPGFAPQLGYPQYPQSSPKGTMRLPIKTIASAASIFWLSRCKNS